MFHEFAWQTNAQVAEEMEKYQLTWVTQQQVGYYFSKCGHCWQVRNVLCLRVCVYSVFTRVVQPQHAGRLRHFTGSGFTCSSSGFERIQRREGEGRMRGETAPMRLSWRAHRQSCSKVLLDVTQSPARRLQFKRKTAQPDPLTREKGPCPIVKQLQRDLLAVFTEKSGFERVKWCNRTEDDPWLHAWVLSCL